MALSPLSELIVLANSALQLQLTPKAWQLLLACWLSDTPMLAALCPIHNI